MPARKSFFTLLLTSVITMTSYSQNAGNRPVVYVGSTPCDEYIKSVLNVPGGEKCEFIKWELTLTTGTTTGGTYQLVLFHGESKPNTNGFKDGGNKMEVKGTYVISNGVAPNPASKIYQLQGTAFRSPLLLVKMDENIFHFADNTKKLLVGNGGWGYVLNRIKQ